ncbi:cyclic nucleotide-binding domain-containing protein [Desertifilum sp. FACHB-1129]|uniref:histidine kinase n=1 Tax=Desertifilum tharense IPPAS B-1220 TaxID=1781255 RepID=A0A1E5QI19_9CYAN|nr:cyclic nucleotide-binding domain-containing protein [Desertifilum sp. FACHB-1129]MBD2325081.1 cyclic nucleotide-binding domain-containing protein [Desertifilum sp. FACHB-866]MBD2335224.1 cyclic nucleotide-binding domain-containing protein [Desertifilum sp. FACHB-868]MDA0211922.1 ATP-binding protein [Cyanobacteria bacterium FC1]OEJ73973.1 cyclic nucleotide-binding protein [Desertifilum tharense IPPAS B-1220]
MNLESHRFFSYFQPEQVSQLCALAEVESFGDRKVIFDEGEIPDFLYLVLEGQVEFCKRISASKYQAIAFAHANELFGEFGVLDGQPRSARAIACAGARVAKIPRDGLMAILQNTPGTAVLEIFRHIIHQLRMTTTQYVNQIIHQEKMVLVGEMVNTLIHDFKSPFNGIQLSSEIIKEMHPEPDIVEGCDLIEAQITRMVVMAEEVLEFSRGNSSLNKKPTQLEGLFQQFEKLNHTYFQFSQVEYLAEIEPIAINIDETKIFRVLQNLVTNAVEAFEGRGGRIKVRAKRVDKWLEISIADNGPGIPEEIRDRFFEAFVTQGKRGGTGLGSAIAKSIVDAHEGQIYFQSQTLGGTTFYIRLPLDADLA